MFFSSLRYLWSYSWHLSLLIISIQYNFVSVPTGSAFFSKNSARANSLFHHALASHARSVYKKRSGEPVNKLQFPPLIPIGTIIRVESVVLFLFEAWLILSRLWQFVFPLKCPVVSPWVRAAHSASTVCKRTRCVSTCLVITRAGFLKARLG